MQQQQRFIILGKQRLPPCPSFFLHHAPHRSFSRGHTRHDECCSPIYTRSCILVSSEPACTPLHSSPQNPPCIPLHSSHLPLLAPLYTPRTCPSLHPSTLARVLAILHAAAATAAQPPAPCFVTNTAPLLLLLLPPLLLLLLLLPEWQHGPPSPRAPARATAASAPKPLHMRLLPLQPVLPPPCAAILALALAPQAGHPCAAHHLQPQEDAWGRRHDLGHMARGRR